ncbi:hypothetical protein CAEBREN_08438 [Caenorhabditis brenneri]|uniref:Uncharacterized protein n=1 Tax=Caenorhabditis brenneri TaxID=135651 RepID=G0MVF4_CAEBE|nr:hypothetical protein CAEBREN_08438 [Caenorhabditis brenneri]
MRLRIIAILLTMCLFTAANDKKKEPMEEENPDKQKIHTRNFINMQISPFSRQQFAEYLSGFCVSTDHMTLKDYLDSYIQWEQIEFLDGVQKFLDPYDKNTDGEVFKNLGHYFASNCSVIDDKQQRDTHHTVAQEALFDNYMYDQMTRNEWTRLYL